MVSTFDRLDLVTMGECDVIEEVRTLIQDMILPAFIAPNSSLLFASIVSLGNDW